MESLPSDLHVSFHEAMPPEGVRIATSALEPDAERCPRTSGVSDVSAGL
jgi:hypothetical protein